MLIIAIPKSASTSLAATLAKNHNKEYSQLIFPGLENLNDYNIIANYHSDIRKYPKCLLDIFCNSPVIFKQHIPPTEEHINYLKDHKKIILLRQSGEIIDAYRRAELRNLHPPRKEFKDHLEKTAWRARAEEIGLKKDLDQFFDNWNEIRDDNTLIINTSELISCPAETIRSIEKFWGMPHYPESIHLARERYSRKTAPRIFIDRVLNAVKAARQELCG